MVTFCHTFDTQLDLLNLLCQQLPLPVIRIEPSLSQGVSQYGLMSMRSLSLLDTSTVCSQTPTFPNFRKCSLYLAWDSRGNQHVQTRAPSVTTPSVAGPSARGSGATGATQGGNAWRPVRLFPFFATLYKLTNVSS